MGVYARQYTLEHFGVDIGDDENPARQKPEKPQKRFGCSCKRAFISAQALNQHQADTGHADSKRVSKAKKGDV